MLSFFIRFFLRTLELFKGNSSPKKSIATILKSMSIIPVKKHLLANDFVKDGVGKLKKNAYLCSRIHRLLPSEVVGTKVANRLKQNLVFPSVLPDRWDFSSPLSVIFPFLPPMFLIDFSGFIRLEHIDVGLMRSTPQNNPFVFIYCFCPFGEARLNHFWV